MKTIKYLSALATLLAALLILLAACGPATEAMGEMMFGTPTIRPTQVPAESLELYGVTPVPTRPREITTPVPTAQTFPGPRTTTMVPGGNLVIEVETSPVTELFIVADLMANDGSVKITIYSLDRTIDEFATATNTQTTAFSMGITAQVNSAGMVEIFIPTGMSLVQ